VLSKETIMALDRLEALAKSLRELNLRKDADRIGVSFFTRAKMDDPGFVPSNDPPWRILPEKTQKLFRIACARPRSSRSKIRD